MRFVGLCFLVLGLFVSGCTALISIRGVDGIFEGYTYNLPQSLLKITVRRVKNERTGNMHYVLVGRETNNKTSTTEYSYEIPSIVVPDPRHKYAISYQPSSMSDDRLCISRTESGLLHDVQFAADDRTPQMVFNISRFIGGSVSPVKLTLERDRDQPHEEYTKTIDPFNKRDWEAFNNGLRVAFNDPKLSISFKRFHKMARESGNTDGRKFVQRRHPSCQEGYICYRSRLMLPVDLMRNGRKQDVAYADVINPWDIGIISVKRAFLVKKITKLRFDEGVLAAAVIKKPSEVEEVTLLPLNILNAILTVPTGLWRGAFSDSKEEQDNLKEIVKLQARLKEAQENYKLLIETNAGAVEQKAESYKLNCGASKRSGSLNWLGNFEPEGSQ